MALMISGTKQISTGQANTKFSRNRYISFSSSDRAEGWIRVSTDSKKVRRTIPQGLAPNRNPCRPGNKQAQMS